MTNNIVPFTGLTTVDLPPDQILEGALEKLKEVVVLGVEIDTGSLYVAGNSGSLADVNWLIDQCKTLILNSSDEEE